MSKPESFDLSTEEIAKQRRCELLKLFPEVRSEGNKIDFDRLRLVLGEQVDFGKERYFMNWPGKADCFKAIQRPSLGTLLPVHAESVNFDKTESLIIEGDNLEVLKLLQKSYQGKIKMIYIDPPYNTGNDFIYPDNYSENLQTYLEYTGQVDSGGHRFSNNTETDGRFHSKWLNMMYPRIFLARNLLTEDGVMFVSIDDHESHNLRRICDEVFGESNFICTFTWEKRYSPPPDTKDVGYVHENILLYRKSDSYRMGLLPTTQDQQDRYKNPDNDPRGPWKPMDYTCRYTKDERPNLYYEITNPNTKSHVLPKDTRVWAFSHDVHLSNVSEKRIWWGRDGKAKVPALKNFLSDIRQGMMPMTLLKQSAVGNTDEATKELRQLIPDLKYTPKPVRLIKHLAAIANLSSNDYVLDFFAGSGTTAHAVLDLNRTDGGNRKFILIQLPEPTEREDFNTISDITMERVRRVIQRDGRKTETKLVTSSETKTGFRVLKLATSNFKIWNAATDTTTPDALAKQLELQINHIQQERTSEDLLFEILLKAGFPPTTPIETLTVEGKKVYSVTGYGMLICLERQLTHEAIKAIAERKPNHVVCLDEGFAGNDQLKTNAVLIMKSKGVTKFQTI